jgi:hypothetical protein
MSNIIHYGYGYSKRLCEDASCWFFNKFLIESNVIVDIQHRGMKRESAYGYCSYDGEIGIFSQYSIELDTHMNKELYIKTLFHELTHLKQWEDGSLQMCDGKMCYHKEPVDNYRYDHQPHEIEAREQEETLYLEYMKHKNLVPVGKVVQFFPNRLMQAV